MKWSWKGHCVDQSWLDDGFMDFAAYRLPGDNTQAAEVTQVESSNPVTESRRYVKSEGIIDPYPCTFRVGAPFYDPFPGITASH